MVGPGISNSTQMTRVKNRLIHRGPDDQRTFQHENFFMGHVRLAIQDPVGSFQPMISHSGNTVMSFNGEIYNVKQLRDKLPSKRWKTYGDTEVLLELIEHFGLQILNEIEGMFALSIYSINTKELTLVRDSMGEKPLYYYSDNQIFMFSSELRSILPEEFSLADIDIAGLQHFLKYLYFPKEFTIHREIKCLEPGTSITFRDGIISKRMWKKSADLQIRKPDSNPLELRKVIEESVSRCLLSDAPLGIMLSGGIDSSIIAYEVSKLSNNVTSYSVTMPGHSEDGTYARLLAKELNLRHVMVKIEEQELQPFIYDTLSRMPQPFGDTAILPLRALTKSASKDVKVLLSGDGADELFSGYSYYDKYFLTKRRKSVFGYSASTILALMNLAFGHRSSSLFQNEMARLAVEFGRADIFDLWCQDLAIASDQTISKMFKEKLKINKAAQKEFQDVRDVLFWDQSTYLPDDLLFKSDAGGMLSSIEIRSPFLNPRLVAFARHMNFNEVLPSKLFLKNAYRNLIPEVILNRKKQGFGAPIKQWIEDGLINDLIADYVDNKKSRIYELIDHEETRKACKGNALLAWNIMSLNIWLDFNLK